MPALHGVAGQKLVVLVVAVDEERGPGPLRKPVKADVIDHAAAPDIAKVAADYDVVPLRQGLGSRPALVRQPAGLRQLAVEVTGHPAHGA